MKKFFSICFAAVMATPTFTQTISNFENLSVPADSFFAASNYPNNFFSSGNVNFSSVWDTSWGGLWGSGFVPSTKTDKTTAGYTNQYSASTGSGYNSNTYAIGKGSSGLKLVGSAANKPAKGFYVTNSTYANLSMKDGDQFGKKFGGNTGNDPDFFLLTVKGFNNGIPKPDSVNFYLADFRFNDNNQDYILDSWAWVDLQSIGDVDSLFFKLTSSDVGQFGMNTPSYFAIDNFTTTDGVTALQSIVAMNVKAFPNPVAQGSNITITLNSNETSEFILTDISGRVVYSEFVDNANSHTIYTDSFGSGSYMLTVRNTQGLGVAKIVVE